jgi:hypothetical protein
MQDVWGMEGKQYNNQENRHGWKDNIKNDLREIGCGDMG